MEQYINKSTLVAEIERLTAVKPIDEFQPQVQNKIDWLSGKLFAINSLRVFLDTLEVKEVDFEKELDEWMKIGPHTSYPWCTIPDAIKITAEHFFELGLSSQTEDMIEALRTEYEKGRTDVIAKTLEWINAFSDNNYIMQYSDSCEHPINEIIEWYKNYINRE